MREGACPICGRKIEAMEYHPRDRIKDDSVYMCWQHVARALCRMAIIRHHCVERNEQKAGDESRIVEHAKRIRVGA
jgi:hypothetical protein